MEDSNVDQHGGSSHSRDIFYKICVVPLDDDNSDSGKLKERR